MKLTEALKYSSKANVTKQDRMTTPNEANSINVSEMGAESCQLLSSKWAFIRTSSVVTRDLNGRAWIIDTRALRYLDTEIFSLYLSNFQVVKGAKESS